jgi:hypothetical protein
MAIVTGYREEAMPSDFNDTSALVRSNQPEAAAWPHRASIKH